MEKRAILQYASSSRRRASQRVIKCAHRYYEDGRKRRTIPHGRIKWDQRGEASKDQIRAWSQSNYRPQKLRKEYAQYAEKRKLCGAHDIFLADERIVPMLTKPLGKIFSKKEARHCRETPPRKCGVRNRGRTRDCTYLYLGGGSCSQVNVGRTNFKDEDVTENVVAAISEMIAFIPKKWKGIRSLHLKTADSVAL